MILLCPECEMDIFVNDHAPVLGEDAECPGCETPLRVVHDADEDEYHLAIRDEDRDYEEDEGDEEE